MLIFEWGWIQLKLGLSSNIYWRIHLFFLFMNNISLSFFITLSTLSFSRKDPPCGKKTWGNNVIAISLLNILFHLLWYKQVFSPWIDDRDFTTLLSDERIHSLSFSPNLSFVFRGPLSSRSIHLNACSKIKNCS